MELYTISEMQKADQLAVEYGISGRYLMERAGLRVAGHLEKISEGPCQVSILAGPGNNGGDAFVIARLLKQRAYKIDIFELCTNLEQVGRTKSDAVFMKEKWLKFGEKVQSIENLPEVRKSLAKSVYLIDGLFGAGLNRPIEEPLSLLFNEINQSHITSLAIDVPSGLNGDTGQVMGNVIKADHTFSFYRPKQGHYLFPGRNICGNLHIDNIGIPERINKQIAPKQFLNSPIKWRKNLKQRSQNSHKYHHGSVLVVSGDETMRGAAVLSSNAAVKAGAGLVTMVMKAHEKDSHPKSLAAIMLVRAPAEESDLKWQDLLEIKKTTAVLIGPGSLPNKTTQSRTLSLLNASERIVLDAGALTAFSECQDLLSKALNSRQGEKPSVVLTPHEGEFKKLFPDLNIKNKIGAARQAAKSINSVIVLKGADTVIASPDQRVIVNSNAPSTLATAGAGDVLAGIIAALIANSEVPLFEAAAAGVYIHGECANQITTEFAADDLIDHIASIKHKILS